MRGLAELDGEAAMGAAGLRYTTSRHHPFSAHARAPVARAGARRDAVPAITRSGESLQKSLDTRIFRSARRRRNRTYQATGYAALPVLKTGSATRPVPPQA